MTGYFSKKRGPKSESAGVKRNVYKPAFRVGSDDLAAGSYFLNPCMSAFVWRGFEQSIFFFKPCKELCIVPVFFNEEIVLKLYSKAVYVIAG